MKVRKPKLLALGDFHFQPDFEIEEIKSVVQVKPGQDPCELGEELMAKGHYNSYCTFLPKSKHYPEVYDFFCKQQQALNA